MVGTRMTTKPDRRIHNRNGTAQHAQNARHAHSPSSLMIQIRRITAIDFAFLNRSRVWFLHWSGRGYAIIADLTSKMRLQTRLLIITIVVLQVLLMPAAEMLHVGCDSTCDSGACVPVGLSSDRRTQDGKPSEHSASCSLCAHVPLASSVGQSDNPHDADTDQGHQPAGDNGTHHDRQSCPICQAAVMPCIAMAAGIAIDHDVVSLAAPPSLPQFASQATLYRLRSRGPPASTNVG